MDNKDTPMTLAGAIGNQESTSHINIRLGWAYEVGVREQLPVSARLLLQCYARHAHMETGEVCLAQARIETELGITTRTTRTMTELLVNVGLLYRTSQSRPGKIKGHIPVFIVSGTQSAWGMLDRPDGTVEPSPWY